MNMKANKRMKIFRLNMAPDEKIRRRKKEIVERMKQRGCLTMESH
jgi:hypothetical protein